MYAIQKGIQYGLAANTRWAKLAGKMVAGDSVLVANSNEATGLSWALKRRGKTYRRRKETEDKGGAVRVWCVSVKNI